jgi:hypothetical protein
MGQFIFVAVLGIARVPQYLHFTNTFISALASYSIMGLERFELPTYRFHRAAPNPSIRICGCYQNMRCWFAVSKGVIPFGPTIIYVPADFGAGRSSHWSYNPLITHIIIFSFKFLYQSYRGNDSSCFLAE